MGAGNIAYVTDLLGTPDTNRTCDLPLRRGLLYPLSYRGFYAKTVTYIFCSSPRTAKDKLTYAAGTAGQL